MASFAPKCLPHDQYLPCPICRAEAREQMLREQLRVVSYEEWLQNWGNKPKQAAA